MKRIVRYVFIFILSIFLLIGCGSNAQSTGEISLLSDASEQEISDETVKKIIDAINEKDADAIKDIFSNDAIEKNGNMEYTFQISITELILRSNLYSKITLIHKYINTHRVIICNM